MFRVSWSTATGKRDGFEAGDARETLKGIMARGVAAQPGLRIKDGANTALTVDGLAVLTAQQATRAD